MKLVMAFRIFNIDSFESICNAHGHQARAIMITRLSHRTISLASKLELQYYLNGWRD